MENNLFTHLDPAELKQSLAGRRDLRSHIWLETLAVCLALLALCGFAGQWSARLDIINSSAPFGAVASLAVGAACAFARRWWASAATLVALAIFVAPIGAELQRPILTEPFRPGVESFTIVTHNVRFDNVTPAATAAALQAAKADVILLQETDGLDWISLFDPSLYPFHSQCRAGGCSLLILSRWPIVATRYRIRDNAGKQIGPRLVWATVASPGHAPVDVATLHLSWPGADQARQRAELAASFSHLSVDRLIVAGDFNLTPWSWAMRETDHALLPLARMTRFAWSFPSRIGASHTVPIPLLPIDQLFAGPRWALDKVERLPRTGSDHYPLRVSLIAIPF